MVGVEDVFGDGGAFPEMHMDQYPLEMGKKRTAHTKTRHALVPKDLTGLSAEELRKPSEEETATLMAETAALLALKDQPVSHSF